MNKSKVGYLSNIEEETLENENFRKVLYTSKYSQLVVMSLLPGEEIGSEVHEHVDQFIRVESGSGNVHLNDEVSEVKDDDAFIIPAGVNHNLVNTSSDKVMKLYTIYSPANHPDGTIHETKEEADKYEAEHHH